MALIDSLVSYWKMDEASGNRSDSHGSNTLTDNGSVGSATGIINNGGDFEQASSQYLSMASGTGNVDGLTSISISTWIKIESFTATYPIVASVWEDGSDNRAWALAFVSQQPYFYISQSGTNATSSSHTSGATLSTATWYHLVGTFNGSTGNLRVYVNGTQYSLATARTGVFNSSAQFEIGLAQRFASLTNNYFDGIIDEVGFWSKELTSTEVTDLYNSGAGLAYPFSGGAVNTTNFFAMM